MHEYIIKKKIFGGFNRADVINCIASLTENNQSSENIDVNTLKQRIDELNQEIKIRDKKISEYSVIKDIDSSNKQAVKSADNALKDVKATVEFIKKDIEDYVASNSQEIESLQNKTSTITEQINHLKSNLNQLSDKLNGFDFETVTEDNIVVEEDIIKEEVTVLPAKEVTDDEILVEEKEDEIIEEERPLEIEAIVIEDIIDEPVDTFNSIDNFFAEMDKLIAAKKNPEPYLAVVKENPIQHLE